jgi:holo-[acyl-carrier protein] synthase
MNIKTGIDIIEISRIKESIDNLQDKFINRIYTEKEVEYCESRNKQKYQHYAARFAAKEAVFKAISSFIENKYNIDWKDIEVVNDEEGRPIANLINKEKYEIESIDISMSHCKEYAVASVVLIHK